MRRFKIAAIGVGVLLALLGVSSVIGLLIWAVIGALVVGVIVLGAEAGLRGLQVSRHRPYREVGEPAHDPAWRRPGPARCR